MLVVIERRQSVHVNDDDPKKGELEGCIGGFGSHDRGYFRRSINR